LPDLGYPVTPMLVCMLAWAVDGTDFRASRSGGESEPAAAHSLHGCGRAMAQRRGQFAGPRVSGHTDACTHVGVGGRRNRFSRNGDAADPVAAHSMRECRGAMVRRRRLNASLGFPVTPMLARMLARIVDGTDFRLSRHGYGADPVAAHSMRECPEAMVRRRSAG
jgi:hypothetical protein